MLDSGETRVISAPLFPARPLFLKRGPNRGRRNPRQLLRLACLPHQAVSRGRMDPCFRTFLIIGAMKAGTTALYLYLSDHPQVFMPALRDLDFFVIEKNWARGLEWYEEHFREGSGARAVGEASDSYTRHPRLDGVPERVASVRPDMRLIYLVRHPIERIRSHYQQLQLIRRKLGPIDQEVLNRDGFVEASSYAHQIDRYLHHFPRSQLLVLKSEDLRNDRGRILKQAFTFLGVDPTHASPTQEHDYNVTRQRRPTRRLITELRKKPLYKSATGLLPSSLKVAIDRHTALLRPPALGSSELSPSARSRLEEALRPDVGRLKEIMGPDFDGWGLI